MSLDGQVLVISFFALALKLLLWFREEDVVAVGVEPDRKDTLHLDANGLRLRAGSWPDGAEGIVATALRPRLDRRQICLTSTRRTLLIFRKAES